MFDSVIEALVYHGEQIGDKVAVITDGRQVTYSELCRKIRQYAAVLSKQGIHSRDKIVLAADYTERFIEVYFAIHWLGAVSVVVEKSATPDSLQHLIQNIVPQYIILHEEAEGVGTYKLFTDSTSSEISKGDFSSNSLADILFTTGTTGEPKGVMLSHQNEVAGALNVINGGEMAEEDRNLLTMPLHHAFGLTTLRAILYKGSTAVLQEGVASLKKMNDNIKNKKCNSIYMVPSALRVLYVQTRKRLDLLLGTVEKIEFCTAPLDKKMRLVLAEQLKGVRLYNSYGATESARTVYMRLDLNTDKPDAIGKAVQNVMINIVDDNRKEIDSSAQNVGHLAIQGDMNMQGYYHDINMTERVLSDGIFYSEDLGYMDEDGYIYLVGRNNDVINIGGEKVSPFEIENTALECIGVQECACIGVKDPEEVLGYVPVLYVAKETGQATEVDSLREYLAKRLENYKIPYKIIVIDEIPKNQIGKIDRKKLHKLWKSSRAESKIY